ncbi:MAG: DUF4177 domain-containing protein [Campylobacterota bacterium]|nr:DUF4177 domain-containing protein [Campylobacterota bacterium]
MAKEYRVVKYKENMIKAILFGQAKVSPKRFTKFLNNFSDEGWSAISIDRSVDSVFLLFSRENYVIVLERDTSASTKKPKPQRQNIPKEITDSEL